MAAKAKTEWSLVCITRKGKVSILKDLDLYTARETYKKLRPDTHPETYIFPACREKNGFYSWSGGASYGSSGDYLEKVEIIGPPGLKLDPWHGVEPHIVDLRARHERDIADGRAKGCGCRVLTEEERRARSDDERLAALARDVPLAFWLVDEPASVTGTGTAKTAQPVEGRSPARTARRATPNPLPHSHAEAKQPALSRTDADQLPGIRPTSSTGAE